MTTVLTGISVGLGALVVLGRRRTLAQPLAVSG